MSYEMVSKVNMSYEAKILKQIRIWLVTTRRKMMDLVQSPHEKKNLWTNVLAANYVSDKQTC